MTMAVMAMYRRSTALSLLVILSCLCTIVVADNIWQHLAVYVSENWTDRPLYEKIFIIAIVFFTIAGFTGLDGGGGMYKMTKLPIADVVENPKGIPHPIVFMDIKIGDKAKQRIKMELFASVVPKTAENFRALCTGEKGGQLHFKNSIFHRIIPGFMCQGGDFTNHNGTGGQSIYGAKFEDEWGEANKFIPHSEPGLLSMANSGKNTNGSQFFLTTGLARWLDGKHVVFGRVIEGMETVRAMEAVGSSSGTPSKKVTVVDCGEAKTKAS